MEKCRALYCSCMLLKNTARVKISSVLRKKLCLFHNIEPVTLKNLGKTM